MDRAAYSEKLQDIRWKKKTDSALLEIMLGSPICQKLKMIYHVQSEWNECYKEVAQKFTSLKQIMRKFYIDKTDIELLQELNKYSLEDLKDIFQNEKADLSTGLALLRQTNKSTDVYLTQTEP